MESQPKGTVSCTSSLTLTVHTQDGMEKQTLSADSMDNNYKECTMCLQLFNEQSDLDSHVESNHPVDKTEKLTIKEDFTSAECTDKIQCSVCQEKYEDITEYTHHLNTHLQVPDQLTDNINKYHHTIQLLNTPIQLCKTQSAEEHLDSGQENVSSSNMFSCKICNETFVQKLKCDLHVKLVHSNVKIHDKSQLYNPSQLVVEQDNSGEIRDRPPSQHDACTEIKTAFPSGRSEMDTIHATLEPFSIPSSFKPFATEKDLAAQLKGEKKGKPFSCHSCEKHFPSKQNLNKHVDAVHLKLKPFSCTLCDKSFAEKENLTKHINAIHRKLKPFSCSLCDKSFTRNNLLTAHIAAVHNKLKKFFCTLCDKSFAKEPNLNKHIDVVHHNRKLFPCTLCDKSYSQKIGLTRHVDAVHNKLKPFSCTLCDKSFGSQLEVSSHMRFHTKEKPFSCPRCEKHFYSKRSVKIHVDSVHKKLRPFSCRICGKSQGDKWQHLRHLRTVHKNAPLNDQNAPHGDKNASPNHKNAPSDYDNAPLEGEQSDLFIQSSSQQDGQTKIHACTICHKSFAGKKYLTEHMKRHTKENLISCYVCGKQLSSKWIVDQHIKTVHKNIKSFFCTTCNKAFTSKRSRDSHIKTVHQNIKKSKKSEKVTQGDGNVETDGAQQKLKPFPCTLCSKLFPSNSHLTRRMRSHTGETPFGCPLCEKHFKSKRNVNLHIDTVHKKLRPFSCRFCGKAFGEKRTCDRHINAIHKNLET